MLCILLSGTVPSFQATPRSVLTARERRILDLSAEGRDPGAIAALLRLPRESVEEYRIRVAAKLSARVNSGHPFRICEVLPTR